MISYINYTSSYPKVYIIQTHAVVLYGLDIMGVAAIYLVVTVTMQMMIIVIIIIIKLEILFHLMDSDTVTSQSAAVQKDVALLR